MAKFTINMNGVQEQGEFQPLPKGRYHVRIEKVETKKTQNNDPMVNVQYKVKDGEFRDRILFENIVFQENIMGRTKHFLHVIGQPYEGEIEVNTGSWLDQNLIVSVDIKEYEGRKSNEVKGHDFYDFNESAAISAEQKSANISGF